MLASDAASVKSAFYMGEYVAWIDEFPHIYGTLQGWCDRSYVEYCLGKTAGRAANSLSRALDFKVLSGEITLQDREVARYSPAMRELSLIFIQSLPHIACEVESAAMHERVCRAIAAHPFTALSEVGVEIQALTALTITSVTARQQLQQQGTHSMLLRYRGVAGRYLPVPLLDLQRSQASPQHEFTLDGSPDHRFG